MRLEASINVRPSEQYVKEAALDPLAVAEAEELVPEPDLEEPAEAPVVSVVVSVVVTADAVFVLEMV